MESPGSAPGFERLKLISLVLEAFVWSAAEFAVDAAVKMSENVS